ncbi:hypothetical protein BC831DRAFT_450080 [Entophlyctis helioformis]|nr:hypothetical protein BC831DRAFT_450080 [Entophlyctis helioformis]
MATQQQQRAHLKQHLEFPLHAIPSSPSAASTAPAPSLGCRDICLGHVQPVGHPHPHWQPHYIASQHQNPASFPMQMPVPSPAIHRAHPVQAHPCVSGIPSHSVSHSVSQSVPHSVPSHLPSSSSQPHLMRASLPPHPTRHRTSLSLPDASPNAMLARGPQALEAGVPQQERNISVRKLWGGVQLALPRVGARSADTLPTTNPPFIPANASLPASSAGSTIAYTSASSPPPGSNINGSGSNGNNSNNSNNSVSCASPNVSHAGIRNSTSASSLKSKIMSSVGLTSAKDTGLPTSRDRDPSEPSGLVRDNSDSSLNRVCSTVSCVGSRVWTGIDYVSNSVADFLGITSPRYEEFLDDARAYQQQLKEDRNRVHDAENREILQSERYGAISSSMPGSGSLPGSGTGSASSSSGAVQMLPMVAMSAGGRRQPDVSISMA